MPKPGRLLLFALGVVCAWWTPYALAVLYFPSFPATPHPQDFAYYYDAARVGVSSGWSHIYDFELQRRAFYQFREPGIPFDWATLFVSLPPMAWLVAPLAVLPYSVAYWTWVAISFAAYLIVGWWLIPGDRLTRAVLILAGIWVHPLLTNFQMGQNSLLVALATGVACLLLISGRPVAAGGLLAVAIVLKPQVAGLVPITLLAWGSRRLFLSWLAASTVLGLASAASLGVAGIQQFRGDLALEAQHTANAIWTPAILVGLNHWVLVVQVLAIAAALAVGFTSRRQGPELAAVAGLLGTLLAAGYHHEHDFVALLIAAWLWLRTPTPAWQRLWLAPGFLALALVAPRGPAPVVLFTILSLALLAALGVVDELRGLSRSRSGLGLQQAPAQTGSVK